MANQPLSQDQRNENLRAMYSHVVDVSKVFLDWRHKVMTFTFTAVGALLAVAAWMYNRDLGKAIAAPLFLASLLCLMAVVFDGRNQEILKTTYKRAKKLEEDLGCAACGAVSHIPERQDDRGKIWLTYHRTLKWAYWTMSGVLLAIAVLLVLFPQHPPGASDPARGTPQFVQQR